MGVKDLEKSERHQERHGGAEPEQISKMLHRRIAEATAMAGRWGDGLSVPPLLGRDKAGAGRGGHDLL
jgi:hypothetical protein